MAATKPKSPSRRDPESKLIVPLDLLTLIGLVILGTISWVLPERLWLGLTNTLAAIGEKLMPLMAAKNIFLIKELLGSHTVKRTAEEIRRELAAGHILETMELLRCYRPGGWHPPVELNGASHLDAALEQGRGAILLISFTTHCSLISKMAMDAAGYHVTHLSHPRHGFSNSRFGMAVLNPVRTYIESKFLGEREVMTPANPVVAMRRLRRRLKEGGIVSIMARELARRPVETPFLNGSIRLASGAVDLAHAANAPLLPVFTALYEDGIYRAIIGAPLEPSPDIPRDEARKQMLAAFTASTEDHVRHHPGQWRGWYYLNSH